VLPLRCGRLGGGARRGEGRVRGRRRRRWRRWSRGGDHGPGSRSWAPSSHGAPSLAAAAGQTLAGLLSARGLPAAGVCGHESPRRPQALLAPPLR